MTKWLLSRHFKIHLRHGETRSSLLADMALTSAKHFKIKRRIKLESPSTMVQLPRTGTHSATGSKKTVSGAPRYIYPASTSHVNGIVYNKSLSSTVPNTLNTVNQIVNGNAANGTVFTPAFILPTPMSTLHTTSMSSLNAPSSTLHTAVSTLPLTTYQPFSTDQSFLKIDSSSRITSTIRTNTTNMIPASREGDATPLSNADLTCPHCRLDLVDTNGYLAHIEKCKFKSCTEDTLYEPLRDPAGDDTANYDDSPANSSKRKSSSKQAASKGILTSILSKLHNKADDKQKADDVRVKVLDSGNSNYQQTEFSEMSPLSDRKTMTDSTMENGLDSVASSNQVNPSSKTTSSGSMSTHLDPFISGFDSGMDNSRELYSLDGLEIVAEGSLPPQTPEIAPKQNPVDSGLPLDRVQKLLEVQQEQFMKQMSRMATQHGHDVKVLHQKIDNLSQVISTQTSILNKMFLNGKLAVSGTLKFNMGDSANGL